MVSEIPAGDGNVANLFLRCTALKNVHSAALSANFSVLTIALAAGFRV